jgi:hypothetical protein
VQGLPKLPLLTRNQIYRSVIESPGYIQASGAFLLSTMAIFALNLLTGYPKGYDALTYHYLVAMRWLQEQSLRLPQTLDWQYCLPGNAHIGMMVMMSSGLQSLTTLMNSVATCLAGCGTYAIAYKLSCDRPSALLATIVFLTIPIVQFQTFTGYVDLFGAAFIIAGIGIFLYRHDIPQSFQGKKILFDCDFSVRMCLGDCCGYKTNLFRVWIFVSVGNNINDYIRK